MLGLAYLEYAGHKDLLKSLGKHKQGKGCLYIDKLEDVKIDKLKELIEISVKLLKSRYQSL